MLCSAPSVPQLVFTITEKGPTRALPYDFCVDVPISRLLTMGSTPILHSVSNVKLLIGTFNQEKALVGAFSVIVKPVVGPMDHFTALILIGD